MQAEVRRDERAGPLLRILTQGCAPRRRQERQPLYFECSSVYICRTEHLRRTGSLVADDWLAVPVPADEVFDINNAEDFVIAEALMASRGTS